ncbi:MAG TPA: DUF2892 domain-containing protein [Polyangiaceae bacterium]|nr:DUF2892 domain-containing protein [Polyangiaceae bacterium]
MSAVKSAFFVKNVPGWERALRLVLAAGALVFGVVQGGMLGAVGFGSAAMLAFSAVLGFCPMCALAGRRLASKG